MSSWPINRALAYDPAKEKARYMNGAPGAAEYLARIARYNTELYQPSDTRSRTEAMPRITAPGVAPVGSGWEMPGNVGAIADRYGVPGSRLTGQLEPAQDYSQASYDSMPPPETGADTYAKMPSQPTKNAQQRWMGGDMTADKLVGEAKDVFMAKGGSQRTWNKGMAAAGVKPRIDARAPLSSMSSIDPVQFVKDGTGRSAQLGTGAPVTFKNNVPGHKWQPSQATSAMDLPY